MAHKKIVATMYLVIDDSRLREDDGDAADYVEGLLRRFARYFEKNAGPVVSARAELGYAMPPELRVRAGIGNGRDPFKGMSRGRSKKRAARR